MRAVHRRPRSTGLTTGATMKSSFAMFVRASLVALGALACGARRDATAEAPSVATEAQRSAPGTEESVAESLAKRCRGHDTAVPRSGPFAETCDCALSEDATAATCPRLECVCGKACLARLCDARAEALEYCRDPEVFAFVREDARTLEIGKISNQFLACTRAAGEQPADGASTCLLCGTDVSPKPRCDRARASR